MRGSVFIGPWSDLAGWLGRALLGHFFDDMSSSDAPTGTALRTFLAIGFIGVGLLLLGGGVTWWLKSIGGGMILAGILIIARDSQRLYRERKSRRPE